MRKMPKPGYTQIIVKASVRSRLQELASALGYRSINQLLEALIRVNPNATLIFRGQFSEKPNLNCFSEIRPVFWWTGGDLNPRPPECKSGVHARLNYRPSTVSTYFSTGLPKA